MRLGDLARAGLLGIVLIAAALPSEGSHPGLAIPAPRVAPAAALVHGPGLGALFGAALAAPCLSDVRDIAQEGDHVLRLDQRVSIDPEDALLAIDYGLVTGLASINDVLNVDRKLVVVRREAQEVALTEANAVSGIALGGGICPHGGILGGGGVHLGAPGAGPLAIADLEDAGKVVAKEKRRVDVRPEVVLPAIAMVRTGAVHGVLPLTDLIDQEVSQRLDRETLHRINLPPGDALRALAVGLAA